MIIRSRDNARVKRWAKLARDARLRRAERRAIIEGPHLLAAALDARLAPVELLATEAALADAEIAALARRSRLHPVVLSPGAFAAIADARTPPGIAAEIALPELRRDGPSVFLEGVQDAGNVGAIIRSAAAFGVGEVLLDRHCADPWSPKVLRAGQGGHFALGIRQTDDFAAALAGFRGRLICTVARGGRSLRDVELGGRLGWAFGGEGAGLSSATLAGASEKVTIPLAAGAESLNVAATAAICLYEAFSRSGGGS
ncbi:MAG TPA: RNA methyltransferase [Burkholderiales bacterium]|nr:RNA methyltransferase [Burkholderiales bacterium]